LAVQLPGTQEEISDEPDDTHSGGSADGAAHCVRDERARRACGRSDIDERVGDAHERRDAGYDQ